MSMWFALSCLQLLTTVVFGSFSYPPPTIEIPQYAPMSYACGHFDGGLPMETAKIHIESKYEQPLYAYGVCDECYQCLHLPLSNNNSLLPILDPICVIINTKHSFTIGISTEPPFNNCSDYPQKTCAWQPKHYVIKPFSTVFNEYSHYNITINQQLDYKIKTVISSPNKYIPLYIALGFIFFVIIAYNIYRLYLKDTCSVNKDDDSFIMSHNNDNNDDNGKNKSKKKRFVSLDAFRGMSLIVMIFVNYGGGGYWWLSHSNWNGLTVADLVFPWFIFIMGVAMGFVIPKKLTKIHKQQQNLDNDLLLNNINANKRKISRLFLLKKILIRGVKLLLIGILLINGAYYLEYMRIPGVLQYFAVAYVLNGVIIVIFEPIIDDNFQDNCQPSSNNLYIPEIILYWKSWMIVSCILFIDLMIIYVLPVTMYDQKCPTGYIGPGGIGDYGKHLECTGGAHRLVDLKLWTYKHVYQSPTSRSMYHTGWYDPEGSLGALTATVLCFFGVVFGRIINMYKSHKDRIIRWLIFSFILGLIAGCLCGFKQNGGLIPVNKNLWSLSFICCQASTGTFLVTIFYIIIDILNWWDGKPFHWLGKNSIIIYTGSELLEHYFPFGFQVRHQDHYKLLLSNFIGVSTWIYIAGYLYYKGVHYAL